MSEVLELRPDAEHDALPAESDSSSVQPARKLKVGEQLMKARLAKNLSIEQIASQLKWNLRQISQVEAGNYAVLPDHASLRGFVRSYAKILALDPVPLMADLSTELVQVPVVCIERTSLDMPFSSSRMPWTKQQHHRSQRVVAGVGGLILVLLCCAAIFVYQSETSGSDRFGFGQTEVAENKMPGSSGEVLSENKQDLAIDTIPVYQGDVAKGVPLDGQAVAHAASDSEAVIKTMPDSSLRNTDENFYVATRPIVKSGVESENSEIKAVQEKNGRNQAEIVNLGGALALKFKKDSWVQIKRRDGTKVISRLYKAGEEETVNVTEPLDLTVGFAPGVEAYLRGKPLLLEAKKGTTVVFMDVR